MMNIHLAFFAACSFLSLVAYVLLIGYGVWTVAQLDGKPDGENDG